MLINRNKSNFLVVVFLLFSVKYISFVEIGDNPIDRFVLGLRHKEDHIQYDEYKAYGKYKRAIESDDRVDERKEDDDEKHEEPVEKERDRAAFTSRSRCI